MKICMGLGVGKLPQTMPLYGMTPEQPLEKGARHRHRIECLAGAACYVVG